MNLSRPDCALHPVACFVAAALQVVTSNAAGAVPPEPGRAEFALRWNAAEGGPKSAEAALAVLGLAAKRSTQFAVDYFDLPPPTTVPAGFVPILRRSVDGAGRAELTWKVRGDHALMAWPCELVNGHPKSEMDITFTDSATTARSYSYSCTQTFNPASLKALSAKIKPCPARVVRLEKDRIKMEEWHLSNNVLIVEASSNGANTPEVLAQFRGRVVAPLLAAGVHPASDSKTELAGVCE
jgi:hypothetical protein